MQKVRNFFLNLNLEILTVIYLAIPIIIFLIGWLKIYISIVLVSLLLLALYFTCNKLKFKKNNLQKFFQTPEKGRLKFYFKSFLILMLIMIWFGFSGVGGLGMQNGDYEKHAAMLNDLVNKEWPVNYILNGETKPLVYYFAYYLPPAVLGKLFGIWTVNYFTIIWTFIGLLLVCGWFFKLSKTFSIFSFLVFIFFGALDIIGKTFITKQNPFDLEIMTIWPRGLQFSGPTVGLFWVPQHALASWLGISLFYHLANRKKYSLLFLITSLLILWSPFAFIGILPFYFALLLIDLIKKSFSFENFVGVLISLVSLLFLFTPGKDLMSGWIWTFYKPLPLVILVGMYYVLGLLTWFVLIDKKSLFKKLDRMFLTIIFFALLLLPLYWMGFNNDFGMRTTMPAQFLLSIFVTRTLFLKSENKFQFTGNLLFLRKVLIVICICIASFTGLTEITRSVKNRSGKFPYKSVLELSNKSDLVLYLGKKDSLFFKYLSK